MTTTSNIAAATSQLPATLPPRISFPSPPGSSLQKRGIEDPARQRRGAEELRERFTQFVGESFFGQMIKAMRATTGKPAYFYGGRAEEVFQGQLDQKLAEHLTEASAQRIADPMFEHQFSNLYRDRPQSKLNDLTQLRQR